MRARKARLTDPGALELVEQAAHLLRGSPFSSWAAYYLGTLPFMLGLLYFWGDMSRDAAAGQRLLNWPLALGTAFLWMKCWQTVHASQLLAELQQSRPEPWTWRRIRRMVAIQAALQPAGLFLLPLSLVVTLPFAWTYAFYECITILGDGQDDRLRSVWRRSWQQARLWPMQNHWVLWLTSPYLLVFVAALFLALVPWLQAVAPSWSLGVFWLAVSLISLSMLALCPISVVVALNLGATLILVPQLIKMLLGIETQFTRSAVGMMNSTWLAATCGLTFLALDPLLKAVYVLRCFYGESRRSALDLRSELKRFRVRRAGAALLLLLFVCPAFCDTQQSAERSVSSHKNALAPATTSSDQSTRNGAALRLVSPEQLDQAIQQVLEEREYRWRQPREKQQVVEEKSWLVEGLRRLTQEIRRWMLAFQEWFNRLSRRTQPRVAGGSGSGWSASLQPLMLGGIAIMSVALGFLFWQRWRRRSLVIEAVGEAVASIPDLTQNHIAASQLPEDGWLALSRELMNKGETRLALRALYLSSLAHLEQRQLLTIARHKSNLDYLRELGRRAHAQPETGTAFAQNIALFERVWYGFHDANQELVILFRTNLERIRGNAL